MPNLAALLMSFALPANLFFGNYSWNWPTFSFDKTFFTLSSSVISPKIINPSPTSTPNPTNTPTPTLAPTITQPTATPTPTPTTRPTTPTPTVKQTTPTPTVQSNPITSIKSYIMNAINQYRRSKGLPQVTTDPYTCSFAAIRAREISTGFNHDGFTNRINSKTLPYPSYHLVTENLASTPNYQNVVNLWINSPGHAANMQKDTPFVCVENYGNYYAYEGWKP